MTVSLSQLLGASAGSDTILITGITADSRRVQPGSLFVAIPGTKVDGRDFIPAAIEAGASAILSLPGTPVPDPSVPLIADNNPRRRYADMAARFYASHPDVQVAITGTNGKTSVADFLRQIWSGLGYDAASVGTLGVRSQHHNAPGGLTTPDPMALHKNLSALSDVGVTHCALEASSHGLDQYRLDGVSLKAAGFTNLTRDHMDYHKTEQGYLFAKARLFGELLAPGSTAVVNIDSRAGKLIEDLAWGRGLHTLTVGRDENAALRLMDQEGRPDGQAFSIGYQGHVYPVDVRLFGAFQAENIVLAVGLAIGTGADVDKVLATLSHLTGVPGRMELIGRTTKGGAVYVDYAHTPDGLKNVLESARAHNPAGLSVVFGCGGDRDAGKRPQMGKLAADLADRVYVTDDNPRSEEASVIRSEILAACPDAIEIGDRAQAIAAAIEALEENDMLIVAGKGHEEGQTVGDTVLPFSDIEVVKLLLGQRTHSGEK
ncbi:UDP-N-acetylmuramoyl-L-alanyl-D-glutamate--2,6-diaminopimelate ligase [Kordiimonas sediminis]|uniref:UDP-N-acetylmuramoyl-L-alanyl-D-glutamate--2,6-diaminopimelate ligase n=1 Tax=Kordiimonas sediminis TaxID=1735581 RepID=A0A919E7U8_9PROT|nr:UDP-N-acetylmuramoyl-L-alanyl-D-glutamate--2,6-diaminopimelate ligase [Kordiimonas sediminis]GHF23113.1 UDP-N-acetylmuramoyl-L-alanyl-D-glutamate--2,6-diaminopimelate ligase [Kordiimonas sediminis]